MYVPGLCSNACVSANAVFALALHLIALGWMDLHLHLIHLHLHLHWHLIQMHLIGIKCESNETVLLLHNVYFLSWFRLE